MMENKIKIVHILNTGSYSGAENVVVTIINNLSNYIDATYISLEGDIRDVLSENLIDYYPVSKLDPCVLRKAFKELSPDIIHAHDYTAGIMSVLSGTRVPIINHIHNNSPWIKKFCLKSFAYGFSCFFYKRIYTVSNSVMDEFVFGNRFEKKTKIIGNPIDISKIVELSCNVNLQEEYDIVFLGRITEQKNPLLFIDIVKKVLEHNIDVRVIMIGDGELRTSVEEKIKNNNLENNIKLLGFIKNPYPYLRNSKILCLPSLWEGFGLVAVEALALGKPVVCSGVGGLKNIVNNSCGRICNEVKDYVEEIINLLNDTNYYYCKSRGAIEQSKNIINIHEYMSDLLQEYKEIKGI